MFFKIDQISPNLEKTKKIQVKIRSIIAKIAVSEGKTKIIVLQFRSKITKPESFEQKNQGISNSIQYHQEVWPNLEVRIQKGQRDTN